MVSFARKINIPTKQRKPTSPQIAKAPEAEDDVHAPMSPEHIMQLQRIHGNAYVQRLIRQTPSKTPFQSSLIQRAGLSSRNRTAFQKLIDENSNLYKRVKAGSDLDLSFQNFNFTLIKKMLSTNGFSIDDESVKQAAVMIGKKLGDTVEVTAPDNTVDPLERFDEFVEVESGVEIDGLSDADEWKKFILNGIAMEGFNSALVDMTMTDPKKKTKTTLQTGLQHRTQKAANRSVWFKWSGSKVVIYALANHIQNDNTKYRRITSVGTFLSSWKLDGGEATPL